MKTQFTIGLEEKHTVDIDASYWFGGLKIRVDGNEVVRKPRGQWSAMFEVGGSEKHNVEVRMQGLVSPKIELLVDGRIEGSMFRFGFPGM